jgi:glycosyltransferase involved in cell wall biosynthesis
MTEVVWLANNLTHYHRARADAFARIWPGSFSVLELSNRDNMAALQGETCKIALRSTLFPGRSLDQIGRGNLRRSIIRHLETTRPNVCCVNGWDLPGTAVMLDWAIENGVPTVLMSETNQHDRVSTQWKEAVKRRFVAYCGAALVGGAWHREYLIKLGMPPASIFDGYDVVDNDHFAIGAQLSLRDDLSARRELGLPNDYFLACARLEPKKNLRRLIQGYCEYVHCTPGTPWNLVIVGDGPLRLELMAFAATLDVANLVRFMGTQRYSQLPGIYGLARAFVHASTTEQWGLVVNEAMAAGLPVFVSRRCGCVAELVKEGVNGLVFDPTKSEAIAETMTWAHKNVEALKQMGAQSKNLIRSWGPERFAQNLKEAVKYSLDNNVRNYPAMSRAVVRMLAFY